MLSRLLHFASTCAMGAGIFIAENMRLDIATGAYPWADHMPLLAVSLGLLSALLLYGASILLEEDLDEDVD